MIAPHPPGLLIEPRRRTWRRASIAAGLMWIVAWACPPAGADAANAEGTEEPKSFQPGDISIGEPIPLPFAPPPSRQADPPAAPPAAAPIPAAGGPAAAGLPGGWLGLSVAESTAPGRWVIADVAAAGPAAAAGIQPGDEIRAIEGRLLESADDVSQALTAISQGQAVRLTVARADQVADVVVTAAPRPAAAVSRDWRSSSTAPAGTAASTPRDPVAESAAAAVPAAPASVLASPAGPPASPSPAPRAEPPAFSAAPAAAVLPAPAGSGGGTGRGRTALGVRTVPIDPGLQARFRLNDARGAYVIGVVQDLPASRAGIPPGSVIVAIDERPVRSPQDLTRLVSGGPVDRPVSLHYVLPGGSEKRAEVMLQSLELPLEQALVGPPALSAADPPALHPGPAPRTAQRPMTEAPAEAAALREEIGRLRSRLERLEQRVERGFERR